ncbi:MAG: NAD(P)/FAD-dependent oxidoreductase [bacterium]|nr:NAD(P)/FAD-dependent oxidoreductase [bacterium]
MKQIDVAIIGAGAAGMMCALEARKRRRSVILLDHAQKTGEKIRISGGGRCNFTNIDARADRYLSANPHFCKSALRRYTQHDFIHMVERHKIDWFEKADKHASGALFCEKSATQIIDMLLSELFDLDVHPQLESTVSNIRQNKEGFTITVGSDDINCASLVIATGGKSIPKIGATGFGFKVAEQFGINIIEPRPALVPLTFDETFRAELKPMSGSSLDIIVSCNGQSFKDAMLFTHRGLSGPAILQISSFWREGDVLHINMLPDTDLFEVFRKARQRSPKAAVHNVLSGHLQKKIAAHFCDKAGLEGNMADLSDKRLRALSDLITNWQIKPTGSEGYRTAEVTLGGVDTNALSSKTMEANKIKGLYFIGEVVDVTGWLGGYNFQWAWSSGWCAGQFV